MWVLGMEPGPLEEQPMLLAAEPPPAAHFLNIFPYNITQKGFLYFPILHHVHFLLLLSSYLTYYDFITDHPC